MTTHSEFMDELQQTGYMRMPVREAKKNEAITTYDVEIFVDLARCEVGDWTPCSEIFQGVMIQGADKILPKRFEDMAPLEDNDEVFDDNKMLFESVKVQFPDGATELFMKRSR